MGDMLNPDQIAALVEAAKQGQLPEQSPGTPRRRHRVRTVDFSRPTKFTSDHQRRIARAIDTFCQTAATRLSAELRWAIELETINTTQVTWSGAQSLLPANSLAATLDIQPIGTRMLLVAEQSFVLTGLECFLGGSPDRPPRERRMTEIDWMLTRRLIESLVHQLSLVWQDLAGITLTALEVESHNDTGQIASVSEPTLVVVIESRVNKRSSMLALLIPWIAIDPIAQHISGRENWNADEHVETLAGIRRALGAVPVTLRAEVAAVELPVAEILALAPGSVVKLGGSAQDGVSLYAENVKLGRGRPGANGARRAVQVRHAERRQG
ncbi:MAG TPA: FliM/FliN family flagellar motor switch protein [Solirubrobacteraceae bacterium]|nr:FliM/FliN family flagellar motor switch protein [Solirubrobacteraceae bacterium]